METKRFELTQEELDECYKEWPRNNNLTMFQLVARKVVSKVLSVLEPVELEALSPSERNKVYEDMPMGTSRFDALDEGSKATLLKNQKGQLFRLKE